MPLKNPILKDLVLKQAISTCPEIVKKHIERLEAAIKEYNTPAPLADASAPVPNKIPRGWAISLNDVPDHFVLEYTTEDELYGKFHAEMLTKTWKKQDAMMFGKTNLGPHTLDYGNDVQMAFVLENGKRLPREGHYRVE